MKQRTIDFLYIIALWIIAGSFVCLSFLIDNALDRLDKLETYHTESENEQ